jgi:hypothetical protein
VGFANFYRRFIRGFSKVARPLTDLTRQGIQPFKLGTEARIAFRKLQLLFVNAPLLRHFDPQLPTRVITDASGFGIGTVLEQLQAKSGQ